MAAGSAWDDLTPELEEPGVGIRRTDAGLLAMCLIRLDAGLRTDPLFAGLPDDRCQCAHRGYIISGTMRVHSAAGACDTYLSSSLSASRRRSAANSCSSACGLRMPVGGLLVHPCADAVATPSTRLGPLARLLLALTGRLSSSLRLPLNPLRHNQDSNGNLGRSHRREAVAPGLLWETRPL
ncbi:MAG: hypothetical protein ACTHQQ_04180, partial [Solirubrobacteraceae bacterium]